MLMRNVVVIGGGFAGTEVMRQLEKHLPSGWQAVLISEENYMIYTPLLPEVVGGAMLPGHAVAPLRRMVAKGDFRYGRVSHIDTDRRRVYYGEDGDRELGYDHLVLACGVRAKLDLVPGMVDYGMPLKTLGDALYLRNRLIQRLEQSEQTDDPELRRQLLSFYVIGGGSSGVEVAGAMRDFFRAACRQYHNLDQQEVEVVLVESGDRLLPEFPASLGRFAHHALEDSGVQVRFNTRIGKVDEYGCEDNEGRRYQSRNVVCTIGTRPSPLIEGLDLAKQKGRLVTAADMSVPDADNLWAVGDCAMITNGASGEVSPPTAQFALRQGRQLADNIINTIQGRETQPFSYISRGELATVGHHRAVARLYGLKLSGFPAWLLWRAFYLLKMPTLLRKLQVYFEWNIGMIFPQDVTQLHYQRTRWQDQDRSGGDSEARAPRRYGHLR